MIWVGVSAVGAALIGVLVLAWWNDTQDEDQSAVRFLLGLLIAFGALGLMACGIFALIAP